MRRRIAGGLALCGLVSFGFASPLLALAGAILLASLWFAFPELRS